MEIFSVIEIGFDCVTSVCMDIHMARKWMNFLLLVKYRFDYGQTECSTVQATLFQVKLTYGKHYGGQPPVAAPHLRIILLAWRVMATI